MLKLDSSKGEGGGQIRPEWEQATARRELGVEPVSIQAADHADIFRRYASPSADTCVSGL